MIRLSRSQKLVCQLATFFVLILISIFRSTAHADIINDSGDILNVYSYGSQLYILCRYEDSYNIIISDSDFSVSYYKVDISPDDTAYAFQSGKFYFLSSKYDDINDSSNAKITCFDCANGAQTSCVINDVSPRLDVTFGFDGELYYLVLFPNINIYDRSCHLTEELPLTGGCFGIFPSENGELLFCACTDGLKVIRGKSVVKYPVTVSSICQFGNYFSDENSVIYTLDNMEAVYDGFDPTKGNGCVEDWFIGRVGYDLVAVRGEKRAVIGSADDSTIVRTINNTVYCMTQDGSGSIFIERLTAEDIEMFYEEQTKQIDTQDIDTDTDVNDTNLHSDDKNDSDKSLVSGNADNYSSYVYNDDDMIINGIDIGTTAAVFKRKCGDSGAVFYKSDGSEMKSGTLGTGMTVKFTNGTVYSLVIYGDVTGEGSINSRDYRLICNYLFGDDKLEGIYREAGDIVCSGSVDIADLTALDRYIRGKYEILQK